MKAIVFDSKLTFKIQEIPEGKSDRKVTLDAEDLELDDVRLKEAVVEINFYKTEHFIKVDFSVGALVELTCDRSLRDFDHHTEGDYTVIFQPNPGSVPETEDTRIKAFDVRDMTLSINKEARDTIMLGLPIKKLHPDFLDSEGNPIDFEIKKFGSRGGNEEQTDPRWEKLKKLKN